MEAAVLDLPTLDADYAIDPAALASFRAKGHTLLRGVASPAEVQAYHPVIAEAVEQYKSAARQGTYDRPLAERDTYAKAFIQITNLWVRDERVRRFSLARRFGKIAADLLGVDAIRMYHDQALFKEAHGGYTPWHQDQYYWPLTGDKTITMWMPLVDAGAEMGTLIFANGTHQIGPLGDLEISDASEAFFKERCRELNLTLETAELLAGDTTWHQGWTLHKAPGNALDRPRPVMTIIFFADGTRIAPIRHDKHRNDLHSWLGDLPEGALADGELNPIVYRRDA